MADFRLPLPLRIPTVALKQYNSQEQYVQFSNMQLDKTQRGIVRRCLRIMQNSTSDSPTAVLFIDAPAGHGKTHLSCAISRFLRAHQKLVFNCATTALAATLQEDGATAHARYKLPVSEEIHISSKITPNSATGRAFLHAAHIWDEAPNSHSKNIEATEALFRDLGNDDLAWGGVPLVIMMGDFRQIAPVVKEHSSIGSVAASVKMSRLWADVEVIHLTKNYRTRDGEYAAEVTKIGNGTARDYRDYASPWKCRPSKP